MKRCSWVKNALLQQYHDFEWCQCTDLSDIYLFEILVLEMMQAGLSWDIVLQKREAYREALDYFDFYKIQYYDDRKLQELKNNSNLIRNQLKINAIKNNAIQYIKIINEFKSFKNYLFQYISQPIIEHNITNCISDQLSSDLKKRGFKFVGSITIYAYLQAIGMIVSHEPTCFLGEKNE